MAIELREFIGSSINVAESAAKGPINLKEGFREIGPISKDSIIQLIEGIHVGPTRNYNWYMNEALVSSIPTWTQPYQRPLIMHHNETSGKTIGRILAVEHVTQNTRSGTPALLFTCNVPDKEGKEQILDGRLKTVSIGVIAHDVRCSICGEQIELDEDGNSCCGHYKGEEYSGQTCYWQIYKMEAKELSYVIVPSDIYAHNIKTIQASEYQKNHIKESFSNNKEGVSINMAESIQEGKVKSKVIDENVTDESGAASPEAVKVEPKTAEPEAKAEGEDNKPEATEPETTEPKEPEVDPKDKEIEELKAEIEVLKNEKAEAAKIAEDVKKDLEAANEKLETLTADLQAKEEEVKGEVELKEAVENELANVKLELREARESEFNTLRASLSKTVVTKESLEKRSNESLMDAILDLKEEMQGIKGLKNIQEATNPGLDTEKNKNNVKVNVKESKTIGNINVEEGIMDVFSNMFGGSTY